ncbi:hypothetical protein [Sulfoacidibacillus thermotolerans]|uniref:hypothetical protein n=1 Tax=Sulfoacidibacillus thermotolerans TaxID=1765684 RepID=UPI0015E81194|nr:hypothetical protein [Sulfoacidibacillus thermotolerans]
MINLKENREVQKLGKKSLSRCGLYLLPLLSVLLTGCAANAVGQNQNGAQTTSVTAPIAKAVVAPVLTPGFAVVHMVTAQRGFALYNQLPYQLVLATANGGTTWRNITPQGMSTRGGLASSFVDAKTVWVAFYPFEYQKNAAVLGTSDGGKQWTPTVLSGMMTRDDTSPLSALSAQTAFLLSHSRLFTTQDGGVNWSQVCQFGSSKEDPKLFGNNGIRFFTPSLGLLTGDGEPGKKAPWVYLTRTGGRTWQPVSVPVPSAFTGAQAQTLPPFYFHGGEIVLPILFTQHTMRNIVFFRSQLPVSTHSIWKVSTPVVVDVAAGNTTHGVPPMSFLSSQTGFLIGQQHGRNHLEQLLYTENGGESWTQLSANGLFTSGQITELDFVSAQIGYALRRTSKQTELLWTQDGGANWEIKRSSVGSP